MSHYPWTKDGGQVRHNISLAQKQQFQQCVLPVGFVAGNIRTAELGLLFKFFRESTTVDSHLVPPKSQNWNQITHEIKEFSAIFDQSKDETTEQQL